MLICRDNGQLGMDFIRPTYVKYNYTVYGQYTANIRPRHTLYSISNMRPIYGQYRPTLIRQCYSVFIHIIPSISICHYYFNQNPKIG